jgi:hypothetical protein
MSLYRLCIITPNGSQYHSSDTFTRDRAEWHMRNLDRMDGTVVWIEFAEYVK